MGPVKPYTARWVAWSIGIVSIVLLAAALVLLFVDRDAELPGNVGSWSASSILDVISALGVPILGIVIATRRPNNAVGWLFIVAGIALGVGNLGQTYALHALVADPGSLPAGRAVAWLSNIVWPIPISALVLLFLVFPTGHLPSRRWRLVVWLVAAIALVLMVGAVILATVGWSEPFEGINIQGGSAATLARAAILIAALALPIVMLLAVVSIVVRYLRSTVDERLQLKWFLSAAGLTAVTFSVSFFIDSPVVSAIASAALLLLWVAIGVAMLKHNLYDIDVIIGKTIVYGVLAAFITIVYVVVVVVIGAFIGVTEGLSLLATAVVAVAFQPIRQRAQRIANRLVYGKRATPYEVLSEFSEHVGEAYAGEDILERMARLLAEGTGASTAIVWLRIDSEIRPAAMWPSHGGSPAPKRLEGDRVPEFEDVSVAVPVRHQGDLLGLLTLVKPPNEALSPVEEKLVNDLAAQAGLVLRNSRLIEDLRASRQRLVTAQDEERRRLERNLHDGAQQQLIALAVRVRLARALAQRDLAEADEMLGRLETEVADAIENLRDLARGIYPPLLADKGLASAVEAQSRKAAVPVRVETDGIGRYSQEFEAAVYFCVLEALQNVSKYAEASEASVLLRQEDGDLVFAVADDGRGFDRGTTQLGTGLQNMSDRLAALGGTLEVRSSPGGGTTVSGRIPVRSVEPV